MNTDQVVKAGAMTIARSLWLLAIITTVMGVRLSMDVDDFRYVSPAILKTFIPEMILARLENLHKLLRVKETYEYGIGKVFCGSCIDWSEEVREAVIKLTKGHPMMASMLISFDCLDWIHNVGTIYLRELQSDFFLRNYYEFASSISPLPLKLESEADIALFLKNFKLVDERGLYLWFKGNEARLNSLYHNQQLLNSGDTHLFWLPKNDLNYFGMLEKINQPVEIYGHMINLKRRLAIINKDIFEKPMQTALRKLEERLLGNNIAHKNHDEDHQSAEEFCYHVYLMSPQEIKQRRETINNRLHTYNQFNFGHLLATLAVKLGDLCQDFLPEEHRIRASKLAATDAYIHKMCVKREERINYFNRWLRLLPFSSTHHKFKNVIEPFTFIWKNITSLPLEFNNIPLKKFLKTQQLILLEDAKRQLDIVITDKATYIDAKHHNLVNTISVEGMDVETFYYITISLAKQFYFQSSEIFQEGLLAWIEMLAKKDLELSQTYSQLQMLVTIIYPSLRPRVVPPTTLKKNRFCIIS